MTLRQLAMLAGAVLLVGVAGCVPLGTLVLGADDDGSALTIQVGDRSIVKLASNASTGYGWELAELDEAVLANTDQRYEQAWSPVPVVGQGGTEIWEFTGAATGTTTLRLEYVRANSQDEPADDFRIEVTVTAAG